MRAGGVGLVRIALDSELVIERRDRRVQPGEERVIQRLLLVDRLEQACPVALQEADEARRPLEDAIHRNLVQVPLRARVQDGDLLPQRHRLVLVLLEQLGQTRPSLQLVARRRVKVRRELRKGGELAVLREVEAQLARDLPHCLRLRITADTRDADADVEGGPLAGVEQVRLQVDLAVRDRDHVGRDERRHVVGLRLDHRQRRERTSAVSLVHLGRSFEQPRVEVEHVAGIGLAAWRPAQRGGDLPVCPRLLGQVVVAAKGFLALLHEVLAHRAACIRCDELQRCWVGRGRGDDDRVVHRTGLFQRRGDARDRRRVLPDRHVNAEEVFSLLVDDRVEQDRRLSREAVADDQLALAAADGDHRVDRLDAGLNRAVHALARDHARGDLLDRKRLRRFDRALVVERHAQRVDDSPQQLIAHRDLEQPSRGAHLVALVQVTELAEDDRTHLILFQVQGQAERVTRELEELAGHRVLQAVDLRDAVADGDDSAHVGRDQAGVEILEPFFDYIRDLFRADSHLLLLMRRYVAVRRRRSCCNLVATLASTTRSPY